MWNAISRGDHHARRPDTDAGPDTPAIVPTSTPPTNPPGYDLLDEIARVGIVYRDLERYPADSPAALRFLSEARITGQLRHAGIPAVPQVGALGRPSWR